MTQEQHHITSHEAQIYDRQIRLWGIEAQNRLRNSSVLLVGLSGLGAEIAKNLMLSGLKSLSLMDDKELSDMDKSSQFLIASNNKHKNRAEASLERVHVLNPMVHVTVITESVINKSEDFFTQFDLIILIDQGFNTTNYVSKICRKHRIRFQAGGIYGWIGYGFFDFNNHIFLMPKHKETEAIVESFLDDDEDTDNDINSSLSEKKRKINGDEKIIKTITLEEEADCKVKQSVSFPSYEQTFDIKLSIKKLLRRRFTLPMAYYVIRAFLQTEKEKNDNYTKEDVLKQWKHELEQAGSNQSDQKFTVEDFDLFFEPPLNPVCAIVGSILSQEAIKALSQNDVPLKNMFLYTALDSAGYVCEISA